MLAISKNLIKDLRALHLKKYRLAEGIFIAEGDKIVSELLGVRHWEIVRLFALPTWIARNEAALRSYKGLLTAINERDLAAFSTLSTPQEVAALVKMPASDHTLATPLGCLNIALDRLSDPGNLGTIIRIADWFGIPNIYCSTDCVELYNPKTIQATMGSIWRVNVFYTDLKQLFASHKNDIAIYGAVLDGDNVFDATISSEAILLIGSESHGIRSDLFPFISQKISIPRIGQAESLNAAIATGIIAARFAIK